MTRKSSILTTLAVTAACALVALSVAAQSDTKPSPAGTWTWTTPGRNGGPDRTNTLTLKVDGSALSGKLSSPGRQGTTNVTEISDGKVTADGISFAIVREFNGNSRTNSYSGKVSSDSITGKMEYVNRDGDPQSRDWTATRSTNAPAADTK